MIRVLLVDDEPLVRSGVRMILESEDDLDIVGEAADGNEALELARQLSPDVVLLDIRMPGLDGIQTTRRLIEQPPSAARILILTTFDLDEYVYEAMKAGAGGFLLKDIRRRQLTDAIRTVVAGEMLVAGTVTRRLVEEFCRLPSPSSSRPAALDSLTAREAEVLTLVARGLSNSEIAEQLVVAETTVKTHVARLMTKLDLRDRAQAVVLAYECGLVRPGS